MEVRLSRVVESVWLVEQSTGRDEALCSTAVTGGKGVSLGLADCDGGYKKIPSPGLVVVQKKMRL